MIRRDDAYKKARQSKFECDWALAHSLRNKVNSLCKNAKMNSPKRSLIKTILIQESFGKT